MLERLLIRHCSPTLAGIKTANLFNWYFLLIDELAVQLEEVNEKLNSKGIYVEVLSIRKSSALILAYRNGSLTADLNKNGVAEFLSAYGYRNTSVGYAIGRLKKRLAGQCGFPHEIGLFLGYPLEDVTGFINNAGKNSKCVGCWKVYCNEHETVKLFERYKRCTDVYRRMFAGGHSIVQLTVAA